MEIALIISAGVVLMVFFPSLFSYFTEKRKRLDKGIEAKVNVIEQKVQSLEEKLGEKDERILHLENEIAFVNKLLEDNSKIK